MTLPILLVAVAVLVEQVALLVHFMVARAVLRLVRTQRGA